MDWSPRRYPNLHFYREPFCQHDLYHRILQYTTPQELKLQVIGNYGNGLFRKIHCIDQREITKFLKEDDAVQSYGSRLEPYYAYEPKDQLEVVVVKIGDAWYRALFLDWIYPTISRVFCFDYGLKCIAHKENIRVRFICLFNFVQVFSCQIFNYKYILSVHMY